MSDRATILLAIEAADDRQRYRQCLEGDPLQPYIILEVSSAAALLQQCQHTPQLILLDDRWSNLDSLELLPSLIQAHPDLAIVLLVDPEQEVRGIEAVSQGAQDYWLKGPIEGTRLRCTVRSQLKLAQLQQALRQQQQQQQQLTLALQRSQDQFQDVLNSAINTSIFSLRLFPDRTWQYLYQSAGCETMFGHTAVDILADKALWLSQVYAPDVEQVILPLLDRLQQENILTVEFRYHHKDGSLRWIACSYYSRQDELGWIVTGVCEDITARKQAEQALQRSEDQLQLIATHLPGVVYLCAQDADNTMHMEYVSPGCRDLLGVEPEAAIADIQTILDCFHPDDRPEYNRRSLKSRLELTPFSYEWRHLLPSSELKWLSARSRPERRADGSTVWRGVIVDISDRKQAEEALQQKQALLSGIIEGTQDLVAAIDLEFRFIAFNRAYHSEFLKIFGYDIQLGTCLLDALAHLPQEQANAVRLWQRAMAGEEFTTLQEFGDTTRQRNCYEITYSSIRNPQGALVGVSHISRNVSERIQAEQALHESEARFRNAFDDAPIGMALVSLNGHLLKANLSLGQMLGYAKPELLEKTLQDITHPEDVENDLAHLRLLNFNKVTCYQIEKRFLHKRGQLVWGLISVSLVRDEQHHPLYFIAQIQDITRRKRAEDELRKNQTLLLEAQRIARIGNWEYDPTTQTMTWGKSLFQILHRPSALEAPTLAETLEIYHPDDRAILQQAIEQALTQGNPFKLLLRVPLPDGSLRYTENLGQVKFDRQDQVRLLYGTVQDVSDRVQAEQALRDSEVRFRSAFDDAATAIVLVALSGQLMRVNPVFCQMLGYTPAELQALCFQDITHPDDLETDLAYFHQLLAREIDTYQMEKRYLHKQGQVVWGLLSVSLVRNAQGEPLYCISQVQDISDRKQAEKQLELQAIITRTMAEGICLVRVADAVIVYANPKFEQMFEYLPGELNGQPVSIINCANDKISGEETARAIMRQVMLSGATTYEIHNIKKDGTLFWCQATASMFTHPDYGKVLVAVQQDITERKQAEEQIRASLREKEVLLKEIHHRVKNNLQIVDGLLKMQARRITDPQVSAILRDSQSRIASIALVHEKLYRSTDLANIDFSQYVRDLTVHLFESYNVDSNHIQLHTEVEGIFLEIETAIPCGLIINELVSNALKYAFAEGRTGAIWVTFQHSPRSDGEQAPGLTLTVRDNGVGLPPGFEITSTRSLGMTLVQGLVEQLEGTLQITGTPGTQFQIRFRGGNL